MLVASTYPWDVCVAACAAGDPGERAYLRALARRVPLVIAPGPEAVVELARDDLGSAALIPRSYEVESLCRLIEAVGTTFAQ